MYHGRFVFRAKCPVHCLVNPPSGINGMKIIINKKAVAMTTVSHRLLQQFSAVELHAILSIYSVIVVLIKKEY